MTDCDRGSVQGHCLQLLDPQLTMTAAVVSSAGKIKLVLLENVPMDIIKNLMVIFLGGGKMKGIC